MKEHIDEMTKVLVDYTKKKHIMASHVILEDYAEQLYNAGYRKQEWISVHESLPEDGAWVLGYSAKSGRGGLCNCLKSYVREFGNYDDTTHWLPLPEFPNKKGK